MTDDIFSLAGRTVWVAGHRGMVGSAIVRRLARENCEILTVGRGEVDLREQAEVRAWVAGRKPDVVFLAAARVGGIHANDVFPAEFLYDNLMIEANIVHAAHAAGTRKLVFLGSSCIYPKFAPQPMRESALLTGPLEPTNEWYAIAKIAGIKLCQAYRKQYGADFISGMPTNLYGPGDNYDLDTSHVLPALIRKAHEARVSGAKSFTLWGTGSALREFLHVDDCADAVVLLAQRYSGMEHVNIGSSHEITMLDLARLVAKIVGFAGEIALDRARPDGAPRKLMNSDKLRALGWRPAISLEEGIAAVYAQVEQTYLAK